MVIRDQTSSTSVKPDPSTPGSLMELTEIELTLAAAASHPFRCEEQQLCVNISQAANLFWEAEDRSG